MYKRSRKEEVRKDEEQVRADDERTKIKLVRTEGGKRKVRTKTSIKSAWLVYPQNNFNRRVRRRLHGGHRGCNERLRRQKKLEKNTLKNMVGKRRGARYLSYKNKHPLSLQRSKGDQRVERTRK